VAKMENAHHKASEAIWPRKGSYEIRDGQIYFTEDSVHDLPIDLRISHTKPYAHSKPTDTKTYLGLQIYLGRKELERANEEGNIFLARGLNAELLRLERLNSLRRYGLIERAVRSANTYEKLNRLVRDVEGLVGEAAQRGFKKGLLYVRSARERKSMEDLVSFESREKGGLACVTDTGKIFPIEEIFFDKYCEKKMEKRDPFTH
jgi:hypothetical protein